MFSVGFSTRHQLNAYLNKQSDPRHIHHMFVLDWVITPPERFKQVQVQEAKDVYEFWLKSESSGLLISFGKSDS